jgi:hypothetical protein
MNSTHTHTHTHTKYNVCVYVCMILYIISVIYIFVGYIYYSLFLYKPWLRRRGIHMFTSVLCNWPNTLYITTHILYVCNISIMITIQMPVYIILLVVPLVTASHSPLRRRSRRSSRLPLAAGRQAYDMCTHLCSVYIRLHAFARAVCALTLVMCVHKLGEFALFQALCACVCVCVCMCVCVCVSLLYVRLYLTCSNTWRGPAPRQHSYNNRSLPTSTCTKHKRKRQTETEIWVEEERDSVLSVPCHV